MLDNMQYYIVFPTAIVTRARSGTEKPKQFDDSYITPAKRKATVPVQTASEAKKVKVEIVTSGTGETYHIVENTGKMDEVAGQVNEEEECKELPSDSETDLSAVTKSGTKLTVNLLDLIEIRFCRFHIKYHLCNLLFMCHSWLLCYYTPAKQSFR